MKKLEIRVTTLERELRRVKAKLNEKTEEKYLSQKGKLDIEEANRLKWELLKKKEE